MSEQEFILNRQIVNLYRQLSLHSSKLENYSLFEYQAMVGDIAKLKQEQKALAFREYYSYGKLSAVPSNSAIVNQH